MVVGDRAAKAQELRQAIEDCVQRKRATRSDLVDEERTRERIKKYREDGERLLRQAAEMERNLDEGEARIAAEDAEIRRLRTELEALGKVVVVDKVQRAAAELEGIDPELLQGLLAERPDLAPLLQLVKGGA